jgi:hypothetical protein
MNRIRRRARAAVNPVSTAVTRWWCISALRRLLTGHGPTARQRRLIRAHRRARPAGRGRPDAGSTPSAGPMTARRQAIDELMSARPEPTE